MKHHFTITLWLSLLTTLCAAQSIKITTKDTVGNVVVPGQTITAELPAHEHPQYAAVDHVHPIPREIPTAAELSGGDAVSKYINARLRAGLVATLPAGVITTDRPIVLRRIHGGVIEGAGPPYADSKSTSGWRTHPETIQATTTIVTTDPTQPALILDAAINVELRNFGVESKGVGIAYKQIPGWGNAFAHLHRIAFHGCSTGFKAGDKPSDHNAADVTFYSCQFNRCETGLEVAHFQGVNYLFDGINDFLEVKRAVVFNEGGFSHLDNCFGMGVGTWLTINGGGSNLMPCRVTHLNSDRRSDQPPPVIVDASKATSLVRVIVDGVKVTAHGKLDQEKHPGHVLYRLPANGVIRVRDNDLNTYPWGAVTEPVRGKP